MDIRHSPTGRIVKTPEEYFAFVPHPLPPTLEWTTSVVNALSRADFLLGKLAREGSKLPNPHLLMRPFITREAVLSSKIEGTHTTIGQLLAHSAGIPVKQDPGDLQEVQNYITALDYGIERLKTFPLSTRLIKEVHEHLMQGVRGSHATPGEFRRSQNWIGPAGCTLNTAKYVPPPVDYLMECIGELEKFLHNRQLPPLAHIALCHYQFEAIHPFLDGNGRIGRLLIILMMIDRQILPSPLLYLSAFFEATRDEYYDHLYLLTTKGSWSDWLIYFANGVAIQSEDVLSRAERINALLENWKFMVVPQSSQLLMKMIDQLAVNPYVTLKSMMNQFDIAYSTAQRNVQRLVSENILQQVGESKRDRVFCATSLLSILEEPTKLAKNYET